MGYIVSVEPPTIADGDTGVVVTVEDILLNDANVYINNVAQTVTGNTFTTITFTANLSGVTLGKLNIRVDDGSPGGM
jgi:predicted amino acid-binding ACT domain protein